MGQIDTSQFKAGLKVEMEGQPYLMVNNEFVKPGKGQAFNRVRLKNILTGRVVDRTFKSGDKLDEADVNETQMRMLYQEGSDVVFMCDSSFEQEHVPLSIIGDNQKWLKEDLLYDVVFYKNAVVSVEPPIFMELEITETAPGVRGDTASGRVMKSAILETGAEVQVPIFIDQGEVVKVDTRNGEYVSKAGK